MDIVAICATFAFLHISRADDILQIIAFRAYGCYLYSFTIMIMAALSLSWRLVLFFVAIAGLVCSLLDRGGGYASDLFLGRYPDGRNARRLRDDFPVDRSHRARQPHRRNRYALGRCGDPRAGCLPDPVDLFRPSGCRSCRRGRTSSQSAVSIRGRGVISAPSTV